MKQYSATNIKNIALLGHGGSGKTTLADAILYYGKATDRIGKSADSTLTLDFDAEEKKRKVSVSTAVFPVEIGENKLNIIDAPGQFDFAAGVSEALTAADTALIVLSGKSGLTVGAQKAYDAARKAGKAVAFFINKLDSVHAHFYRVVSIITGQYGGVVCPVVVPFVEGEKVTCYINLITGKAFTYDGLTAKEYSPVPENSDINGMRDIMLEAVASTDEALMDKYFGGEAFTEEEILSALKAGMKSGDLCPVFCGVGQDGAAVPMATEILAKIAPSAADLAADENGPSALVVFKTIADPFVGKLSYFKVVSGSVKSDSRLTCRRTGAEEKLSKVMLVKAGKQEDAAVVSAGDIGAVAKLGNVLTGDVLCDAAYKDEVTTVAFPLPQLTMAVYPKVKGDEDKIAQGLTRLMEEDPTISFTVDSETKEQLLSGLGEQHIDVIVSKLAAKFGVNVELKTPRVAYRETIRKTVKVQGKHKKQSGGHGQYGDVWIEFSPHDGNEMIFEEKVFGGSVPKNFFPAVEKGLRDSVQKGVLAGYPVVGLKATLVDGSYHPVDSSEMAFKTAASIAYKDGLPQASPVLLEPIGNLSVTIPEDNMGDVIGDINKRRGRVIGMNPAGGKLQEIVAEVPMSEMSDFSISMRSITQGRAEFTLAFERYEEVPSHIAGKIIEAAKAE